MKIFTSIKVAFKLIRKRCHICSFDQPIASAYVSFNTRDILYECKCGKREIQRLRFPFDKPFPIKTTPFLTHKELESMLLKSIQPTNQQTLC